MGESSDIPLLMLAPMAGITDLPFRLLAIECGADEAISELVSAVGIVRFDKLSWRMVQTDPDEKGSAIQLFGGGPEMLAEAAKLVANKIGALDLNFGCPAPKVTRSGGGAAMLNDPDRLVISAQKVRDSFQGRLSVKLRLGVDEKSPSILALVKRLEQSGVDRITIHGRYANQGYSGKADWDAIKEVVDSVSIPVIANGDITGPDRALDCLKATRPAGLMIGRAAMGRPEVFWAVKQRIQATSNNQSLVKPESTDEPMPPWGEIVGQREIRSWAWGRYLKLAELKGGLHPRWLRRHAINFTRGLAGSRELRPILHHCRNEYEMGRMVEEFLRNSP